MFIEILHARLHNGAGHIYAIEKVNWHFGSTPCYSLFAISIDISLIRFRRYFQAGGTPEQVINQLSQNYTAVAQMANLLAEWLILAGVCVTDVQAMVENHLKDMILRTFDPKKADTIFTEEGEVSL